MNVRYDAKPGIPTSRGKRYKNCLNGILVHMVWQHPYEVKNDLDNELHILQGGGSLDYPAEKVDHALSNRAIRSVHQVLDYGP